MLLCNVDLHYILSSELLGMEGLLDHVDGIGCVVAALWFIPKGAPIHAV